MPVDKDNLLRKGAGYQANHNMHAHVYSHNYTRVML